MCGLTLARAVTQSDLYFAERNDSLARRQLEHKDSSTVSPTVLDKNTFTGNAEVA